MDFTPRYVPRSLPLLLLQDDYSVPLGSALFHPSRERGVLLPLACLCHRESQCLRRASQIALMHSDDLVGGASE